MKSGHLFFLRSCLPATRGTSPDYPWSTPPIFPVLRGTQSLSLRRIHMRNNLPSFNAKHLRPQRSLRPPTTLVRSRFSIGHPSNLSQRPQNGPTQMFQKAKRLGCPCLKNFYCIQLPFFLVSCTNSTGTEENGHSLPRISNCFHNCSRRTTPQPCHEHTALTDLGTSFMAAIPLSVLRFLNNIFLGFLFDSDL